MNHSSSSPHLLDQVSLGKIVQIRERLLKSQAQGKRVFRFESGDPDFSLAPSVLKALQNAAAEGKTHYIPNNGIPELRKALAKKLNNKNRIAVTEDDVFLTNGAMHALYICFYCLLSAGDEVIVPEPMWTEVVENIRLAGGVPVPVALRHETQYRYGADEIEKKITPQTKAIFINTPHNPSGAVLSREELQAIAQLAKKNNLWIISDEAYEDVIFDGREHVSIASLVPDYAAKCVSIFSFSKSHAMSGLRVGYIAATDRVLKDRLPKILRCTINGVNSVAQWTALEAVTGDQSHLYFMRDEYQKRRDILCAALDHIPGLKVFKPQGTFFVWAALEPSIYKTLGVRDADALSNTLAEEGLGSSPGDAFGNGCQDAIRFSFSCSTSMVSEGAVILRKRLGGS